MLSEVKYLINLTQTKHGDPCCTSSPHPAAGADPALDGLFGYSLKFGCQNPSQGLGERNQEWPPSAWHVGPSGLLGIKEQKGTLSIIFWERNFQWDMSQFSKKQTFSWCQANWISSLQLYFAFITSFVIRLMNLKNYMFLKSYEEFRSLSMLESFPVLLYCVLRLWEVCI